MSISLPVWMLRDLRALCAMAGRAGVPALAVGAERFWMAVVNRQTPRPSPKAQLRLWEPDGSPWHGRLGPNVPVRCDHFGQPGKPAIVPLKTCLQRQDSRWPGKQAAIHEYCGSGKCAQGADYKLRSAYSAAADWASKSKAGRAAYQFYRKDAGVQRKKRRTFIRSSLDRVPSIDEPPGQQRPKLPDLEDLDLQKIIGRE